MRTGRTGPGLMMQRFRAFDVCLVFCSYLEKRRMVAWLSLLVTSLLILTARASEQISTERKVSFSGNGEFVLDIPRLPNLKKSLEEFLIDEDSNALLVGSDDLTALPRGQHWYSRQPSFTFFGLVMTPIFRVALRRRHMEDGSMGILVEVDESRVEAVSQKTNVIEGDGKDDEHWISSLLSKGSINGESDIRVQTTDQGWIVSLKSQLDFKMKVPKYLPLPPGFASIGSAIMKIQCQERARQSLIQIRDAYLKWAEEESFHLRHG